MSSEKGHETPPKKVFFRIPMGWRELKPEERESYARDIARRILAVAEPSKKD